MEKNIEDQQLAEAKKVIAKANEILGTTNIDMDTINTLNDLAASLGKSVNTEIINQTNCCLIGYSYYASYGKFPDITQLPAVAPQYLIPNTSNVEVFSQAVVASSTNQNTPCPTVYMIWRIWGLSSPYFLRIYIDIVITGANTGYYEISADSSTAQEWSDKFDTSNAKEYSQMAHLGGTVEGINYSATMNNPSGDCQFQLTLTSS